MSLKKEYNPQDLSGFMDDLGMVLQKAKTINSLTPTFKKYEEVTGAKLNFNKCFVLSTEFFKPVGPGLRWQDPIIVVMKLYIWE